MLQQRRRSARQAQQVEGGKKIVMARDKGEASHVGLLPLLLGLLRMSTWVSPHAHGHRATRQRAQFDLVDGASESGG
jgi:hypothetical protein